MKVCPPLESLPQVLQELGINDWDLVLVGDGSGSGWSSGCGWACVLVDRFTKMRELFCGGMNLGSVNLAETMPYVHALTWYDSQYGKERLKQTGLLNVHVITDSMVIAEQGTQVMQPDRPLPRTQRLPWADMRELHAMGYHLTYHWLGRSTTLLNWCADLIASLARKVAMTTEVLPLNAVQLERITDIIRRGKAAIEMASQPSPLLTEAIAALIVLQRAELPLVGRLAHAIEAIKLAGPEGDPISLHELNPDI